MEKTKTKRPAAVPKRYGKIPRQKKPAGAAAKQQEKKGFASPVKIAFLGGLDEVGKNLTVIEYNNEMILIDCGLGFPDDSMPGVDLVIPDFSYLEKNAKKVTSIFITHGHEDHIGGLVYLLKKINVPVYATRLTIGLIKGKLEEHKMLKSVKLHEIKPGDRIKTANFEVEAIHVNHSIPAALAYAVRCKEGVIVHTGDFKVDATPIDGEMMDLARLGELGKEGVLALLSDSTNAERTGYTDSERKVGETFAQLFRKAGDRRLIVATFSSNIHRVQQIIDVAASLGRKVALSGRSLENVVAVSRELGYLNVPDGVLIGIESIRQYPDDRLVIITTGSQGEPMSALSRMASSEHRKVTITPHDYVIISARPIPGNEKTVGNVINELMKLGAEVVYESMYDVHVSGHACQQEQRLVLRLTAPKFFIPVHGELKQLAKHAASGAAVGIPKERIIIPTNGTLVSFLSEKKCVVSDVPAGNVYVDGYGVGDVGNVVLRERRLLSQDGVIVVSAVIDAVSGYFMTLPEIYSRGFVFMKDSAELLGGAREVAERVLDKYPRRKKKDVAALKANLRDDISRYIYEQTKRSPVIIPVITEL